jgi:DNA-binding response OmpR family regulator
MDKLLAESTRVLIIDDQVLAQGYMKYSLQELGFKDISYVDSAISGLKAISTKRYDMIVCSYNLKQDHDGLCLYNELKNKSLLPYSTAFVFISADTSAEIVHSVVDIQPDDFLAKPYTLRELDKRLGRVLKRKSAMRKAYQLMDKKEYKEASSETENILTSPDMSEFFPAALKLKGELLLATEQPDKAKDFYNAILNVQTFSWATIGLIKSLIALNEDEEAESSFLDSHSSQSLSF